MPIRFAWKYRTKKLHIVVLDSRQQIFLNTKAITQQDKNIWRRWEYRRIFGGSSFLIITTSSWHEFVMMTDKKILDRVQGMFLARALTGEFSG